MNTGRFRLAAALVVLFCSAVLSAENATPPPVPFDEARKLAIKDMSTPAGSSYGRTIAGALSDALDQSLADCFEAAALARAKPLELVLVIDATGKVEAVLARPDTDRTKCVARKMKGASYAKPPFAPLHAILNMDFSHGR